MKAQIIDPTLQEIVTSLESTPDVNVGLARLLERQLDRELTIYEQIDEAYRKQYGMSFEEFYHSPLMQQPSFQVEQDYFDWEMAVTLIKVLRSQMAKVKKFIGKQ
jgi:hypothetical protein